MSEEVPPIYVDTSNVDMENNAHEDDDEEEEDDVGGYVVLTFNKNNSELVDNGRNAAKKVNSTTPAPSTRLISRLNYSLEASTTTTTPTTNTKSASPDSSCSTHSLPNSSSPTSTGSSGEGSKNAQVIVLRPIVSTGGSSKLRIVKLNGMGGGQLVPVDEKPKQKIIRLTTPPPPPLSADEKREPMETQKYDPSWFKHVKSYDTDQCSQSSSSGGSSTSYSLSNGSRMLRCNECGKYYRNQYSLRHHICLRRKDVWKRGDVPTELVDGQTLYFCPTCLKPFKWLGNLTRHFYVHTGQRFFRCGVCNKEFFSAYQVRRHMNSHTGLRFKCEICKKPFTCKYACAWHTRQHHNPTTAPAGSTSSPTS